MSERTCSTSLSAGLRKEFGGLVAVNDVDFTIPSGAIVSLIGPNGAGKTTFFNMLTGVYKPTAGADRVRRHGRHRQAAARDHRARASAGRSRTSASSSEMTALENVLVGMHCRLKGGIVRSILRTPAASSARRRARASGRSELLEFCGLRGRDDEFARNLSYGDQRRLEVARALATEPKLLLLDEPTAGMNPQETAEFTAFVERAARRARA